MHIIEVDWEVRLDTLLKDIGHVMPDEMYRRLSRRRDSGRWIR
jgi:hypothetical protein